MPGLVVTSRRVWVELNETEFTFCDTILKFAVGGGGGEGGSGSGEDFLHCIKLVHSNNRHAK